MEGLIRARVTSANQEKECAQEPVCRQCGQQVSGQGPHKCNQILLESHESASVPGPEAQITALEEALRKQPQAHSDVAMPPLEDSSNSALSPSNEKIRKGIEEFGKIAFLEPPKGKACECETPEGKTCSLYPRGTVVDIQLSSFLKKQHVDLKGEWLRATVDKHYYKGQTYDVKLKQNDRTKYLPKCLSNIPCTYVTGPDSTEPMMI